MGEIETIRCWIQIWIKYPWMLCLDIIKAVEKERGKSPVLFQSFRFKDLRCDRRIRDVYIYIYYLFIVYI